MGHFGLNDIEMGGVIFRGAYSWDLEECSVMQHIGTLDMNGTDIYEGDIIIWNDKHWIISWSKRNSRHFFESTNSFLKDGKKVWGEWGFLTATIEGYTEVVGNVFENPELVVEQNYSYSRFDK